MRINATPPLEALRDEELFVRFVAGDDDAYTAMYARYSNRVLSYIYSFHGSDNRNVEDIVYDSFLRLFHERERCCESVGAEPIRNIGGWLFRVARNLSLNHLRSARYLTEFPPVHDERMLVSVEEAHASMFADTPDE